MSTQTGLTEEHLLPESHSREVLDFWLTAEKITINRHTLWLLCEKENTRSGVTAKLRSLMQDHYVAPEVTAQQLARWGAPETAKLLRERLPTKKTSRSGEIGEILATEIAEAYMGYDVPIRRLRWKDGRDMALRGDDIIGVTPGTSGKPRFLKGEAKSREQLSSSVVNEAAAALDRDNGRPSRHSVVFLCDRLREQQKHDEAAQLEYALLHSFNGHSVEHLLFALSGNNPRRFLHSHLMECTQNQCCRYAVGVHIEDLGKFIEQLFGGF
jgi:hypothetical protein